MTNKPAHDLINDQKSHF